MFIEEAVRNLVATGKVHLRRIEALEITVHQLGDDRAHLQTDLNALARMVDAQAVVIESLNTRLTTKEE